MSQLKDSFRANLEVGFASAEIPPRYAALRGRVTRSIPAQPEFPFEDAQFDAVMMDASAVSRELIREANRVLRPDGVLFFTVPERNGAQEGYTPQDIYAVVRDGFNIVSIERSPWWRLARKGRTISIVAHKKAWKPRTRFGAGSNILFSPFHERP